MKEFDKKIEGTLTLESISFQKVLYRKVLKANDRGSKISIPKELGLEGKFVYVVIPREKNKKP